MRLSTFHPAYKKCLLPLILVLAVFFVSQGMSLPNLSQLQEPRLSAPQNIKSSDSVFVKALTKVSQTKTTKSVNHSAFVDRPVQVKSAAVLVSLCQLPARPFIASVVSVIPARAPPA
jgi:hypothetical protein